MTSTHYRGVAAIFCPDITPTLIAHALPATSGHRIIPLVFPPTMLLSTKLTGHRSAKCHNKRDMDALLEGLLYHMASLKGDIVTVCALAKRK